jgi:hypothetical protein
MKRPHALWWAAPLAVGLFGVAARLAPAPAATAKRNGDSRSRWSRNHRMATGRPSCVGVPPALPAGPVAAPDPAQQSGSVCCSFPGKGRPVLKLPHSFPYRTSSSPHSNVSTAADLDAASLRRHSALRASGRGWRELSATVRAVLNKVVWREAGLATRARSRSPEQSCLKPIEGLRISRREERPAILQMADETHPFLPVSKEFSEEGADRARQQEARSGPSCSADEAPHGFLRLHFHAIQKVADGGLPW